MKPLPVLLLAAFCLSTVAAEPPPATATVLKKSATSWETVPLDLKHINDLLKAHPHPTYPLEARRAHATGRGEFKMNFGPDGKVKNIEILQSTGNTILDQECLGTFVHWEARHPGALKAVTVPMIFTRQR